MDGYCLNRYAISGNPEGKPESTWMDEGYMDGSLPPY